MAMLTRSLLLLTLLLLCLSGLSIRTSNGGVITLDLDSMECLDEEVEEEEEEEEEVVRMSGSGSGSGANESYPTTTTSCQPLDEVLTELSDNDVLLLSPGTYTLNRFSTDVVRDLTNLTILGDPDNPESVVITCTEGVGLFFFNVTGLRVSGVTVEGCGIRGTDRIAEIVAMTREIIALTDAPPASFAAALLLVHCPDLEMSHVIVRENRGFGLVGINLVGHASFHRVQVSRNYPTKCVLVSQLVELRRVLDGMGGVGGGVYLTYLDYASATLARRFLGTTARLRVTESNVTDNYVCRASLFHVIHSKLQRSIARSLRGASAAAFSGAGGASVVVGQRLYRLDSAFESCLFRNNSGTFNGAAMLVVVFELSDDSHVHVEGCVFEDNGRFLVEQYQDRGIGPSGALQVLYYVPDSASLSSSSISRRAATVKLLLQRPCSVVVSRSRFSGNVARNGGAVSAISLGPEVSLVQDVLVLNGTEFHNNQADYGGAIFLSELSYSGFEPGLSVWIQNVSVTRNRKLDGLLLGGNNNVVRSDSGIIDVNFLNVSLSGGVYMGYNGDTAISLFSSIARISGDFLLEHNTGTMGGAFDLASESYLIMTGFVNLTFDSNTALVAGGAIHVDFDSTRSGNYDCFAFFNDPDFFCDLFGSCRPINISNVRASFLNNKAPLGSAVYGSTYSTCPWAGGTFEGRFNISSDISITDYLSLFEPTLIIRPRLVSDDSSPNSFNTLPQKISLEVENDASFSVMPGKFVEFKLNAFDQINQPVPLTVFSQVQGDIARASIGDTNRYLIDSSNFTSVPIQVFGVENTEFNLIITSNEAEVALSIVITLQNCSLGFAYNNDTMACQCLIEDIVDGARCNNNGSVVPPEGLWIGFIEDRGFAYGKFIFDYSQDVSHIYISGGDGQCLNNRTGILCGQCREGHSRILGNTRCVVCNNNGIGLVVAFALMGILLVVVISLFNITITDGYINGLIFYSNIVSLLLDVSLSLPLGFKFVDWINLNFGIATCFYNGLTDLQLSALRFVFPLYLGAILLVITAVSKYRRFAKLMSKVNITHVFATLLLISYTSIIRTSIDVLSYVDVTTQSGRLRAWQLDPNQEYGRGAAHILVSILALFFMVVLLPFAFFLLFPLSCHRFSYVNRMKPLIDAFIAPMADGRQFWVGFRLMSRYFLFLLSLADVVPRNIVICVFLILVTILEAYIKPFKTAARNLLDLSLMANLTILSLLVVTSQGDKETRVTVGIVLLSSITVLTLLILAYYILRAFPCTHRLKDRACTYYDEKVRPFLLRLRYHGEDRKFHLAKQRTRRKAGMAEEVTHSSFIIVSHGEGEEDGRGGGKGGGGGGRGRDRDFVSTGFVGYRESLFEL